MASLMNVFLVCAMVVMRFVDVTNAQKALDDSCNEDSECIDVDYAVCTGSKCTCDTGYAPNSGACNQVVTGVSCSSPEDCTSIDNAMCSDGSTPICVCKVKSTENSGVCELGLDGTCTDLKCTTEYAACNNDDKCACNSAYKPNDGNTACVPKGLGDACPAGNSDCTQEAHTECTDGTCSCVSEYVAVNGACEQDLTTIDCSTNGNTDCTADNSVCGGDDKCQCDVGFELESNKCVTESGAASTKAITWMVFSSLLILLVNKLMM